MKKKSKSTYEEFIEDAKEHALLKKECKALLVSELLLAAMEEDHLSVRKLAEAAGISPTWLLTAPTRETKNCRHCLQKLADLTTWPF